MSRNFSIFLLIFTLLFATFSSSSATPPPAKIISGIVSNVASALFKYLWSLKSTPKTAISSRSMMKFEGGYTVETVFDGSKLGIEPYSVEVSPSGELLVVDSENSNIYKVSSPLSRYSRPKLVAGSSEGYTGHVDGKPREARMNHPKGLTVDDRGNIYVADTLNMAIRKISDAGVVTIAGGNVGRGGGHVDGPSEDARFSNDFDVVYIGSSCSILVVDRGNQAIREIQLNDDDCTYHHDADLQLGMAVLAAAAFFGYMLALLQRRVSAMFSSPPPDPRPTRKSIPQPPYQRPMKPVRPPLIPPEDELQPEEEGMFGSMGRLVSYTGSTVYEIIGGLFSRRKPQPLVNHHHHQQQNYLHPSQYPSTWPMQESFVIPREDQPPTIESRDPTPRKNYPFMTKADPEKPRHFKQSRTMYGPQSSDYFQQQQLQQQQQQQQQQQHYQQQRHQYQHHQRHYSSGPQTYYEENRESTNEIVFGAVQEQDGQRGAVVIKAVDYGSPVYGNPNMRSRYNYMGYASYGY